MVSGIKGLYPSNYPRVKSFSSVEQGNYVDGKIPKVNSKLLQM
ncbi:hypothetical protein RINTHM_14730 [Richelia intracellularis HM01]|nr:hypothetical protein RINTHM_14730 [Richelia intracellularis HM01]